VSILLFDTVLTQDCSSVKPPVDLQMVRQVEEPNFELVTSLEESNHIAASMSRTDASCKKITECPCIMK
jgi:hypothetical protein